ncbi:peptide chain release factor 3, partial [Aurantimonas sp. C2-6-R+9]|nr:peptide chain release factor 3 [Aurantimonas sp. C2-6-R+9]
VVGPLQLDVLSSRIAAEYKTEVAFEPVPFGTARWIRSETSRKLQRFVEEHVMNVALDRDERPVFLPRDDWELRQARDHNPDIVFDAVRELVG